MRSICTCTCIHCLPVFEALHLKDKCGLLVVELSIGHHCFLVLLLYILKLLLWQRRQHTVGLTFTIRDKKMLLSTKLQRQAQPAGVRTCLITQRVKTGSVKERLMYSYTYNVYTIHVHLCIHMCMYISMCMYMNVKVCRCVNRRYYTMAVQCI